MCLIWVAGIWHHSPVPCTVHTDMVSAQDLSCLSVPDSLQLSPFRLIEKNFHFFGWRSHITLLINVLLKTWRAASIYDLTLVCSVAKSCLWTNVRHGIHMQDILGIKRSYMKQLLTQLLLFLNHKGDFFYTFIFPVPAFFLAVWFLFDFCFFQGHLLPPAGAHLFFTRDTGMVSYYSWYKFFLSAYLMQHMFHYIWPNSMEIAKC